MTAAPKELAAKFNEAESYFADEIPLHRVKISQPFYMGKHELTVGQLLTESLIIAIIGGAA